MSDSDSDYVVEEFIKPSKVRVPLINDERADILGNFDDTKRKEIQSKPNFNDTVEENPFEDPISDEDEISDKDNESNNENSEDANSDLKLNSPKISKHDSVSTKNKQKKISKQEKSKSAPGSSATNGNFSNQQIEALLRGASKQNRFVLYVTNLNYSTTKEQLMDFFSTTGTVKSVRIPKNRKTAFAFVEMADVDSFKVSTNILSLNYFLIII